MRFLNTALAALLLSSTAGASDASWITLRSATSREWPSLFATHPVLAPYRTVELVERSRLATKAGTIIRLDQRHRGLPVLGAGASVWTDARGKTHLTVQLFPGVSRVTNIAPLLDLSESAQRVSARVGRALGTPRGHLVIAGANDSPVLAWEIQTATGLGGEAFIVDATTGRLLASWSLAHEALGRVYPIGPVQSSNLSDVELPQLTPSDPQSLTGWDGDLIVANLVSGDVVGFGEVVVSQEAAPNVGPDFLYDPPVDVTDTTDAFAQVNSYFHAMRAQAYFQGLGVEFSKPGWDLAVVVNVTAQGEFFDNAFFSSYGLSGPLAKSNLIAMGQASTVDYAIDSDVLIHEFGHYISSKAVGYTEGPGDSWGATHWGSAINEGTADYFACSLNGDPDLGEATGVARNLASYAGVCPDDIVGESHDDGLLIGTLGWSLRETLGPALADQLMFGALATLTPNPALADFARGLMTTADAMRASNLLSEVQVAQVHDAIDERQLGTCEKYIALEEYQESSTQLMGLDYLGYWFGVACDELQLEDIALQSAFHYAFQPPPGSTGLRVTADVLPWYEGDLSWSIYGRAGEHVTFEQLTDFSSVVSEYDFAVERMTETSGELVISSGSDPAFDPSNPYYFVVSHQNCPYSQLGFRVEATFDEQPGTGGSDAGGADAGGTSTEWRGYPPLVVGGASGAAEDNQVEPFRIGGCDCRLPNAPPRGGAGALLMLALLARRRFRS